MEKKGLIREAASGGRTIVEPIMYGSNSSIKFYEGYDTFTPDTASEVVDASEWAWKQLGGVISMEGREQAPNAGSPPAGGRDGAQDRCQGQRLMGRLCLLPRRCLWCGLAMPSA